MTLVTLRPNGTPVPGGVVTGGDFSSVVLEDDSDATYVTLQSGQFTTVSLDDLTLPVGAALLSAVARVRASTAAGFASLGTAINLIAGSDRAVGVTWAAPTTIEMAPRSTSGLSDAILDAASLYLIGTDNAVRITEAYLDVRYVAVPVVTVTAPTGTVSNTNQPLVSWTDTLDGDGGDQTDYEVKIFSAAQYGAGGFNASTSTATASVTAGTALSRLPVANIRSWQVNTILPNATYRAYVRAAQTVNGSPLWSAWSFLQFTVSVALPAAPTVSAVADSANGRNTITVTANSGTATTDALELERSLDGGTTWTAVRTTTGLGVPVTGTSLTAQDYEAPNGTAVLYRGRALHNYSGVYAASAWVQSSATWSSTGWWLKRPNYPTANLTVELIAYGDITRAARHGVFQPLGAVLPIVVEDTPLGAAGAARLRTRSTVAKNSLTTLIATRDTFLLQGPASAGEPDRYVRFGDYTAARTIENKSFHIREHTLPWVEVTRPDGAILG